MSIYIPTDSGVKTFLSFFLFDLTLGAKEGNGIFSIVILGTLTQNIRGKLSFA